MPSERQWAGEEEEREKKRRKLSGSSSILTHITAGFGCKRV